MEVCINGYWGHVCYNGWDSTRALVVCKQLFGENISKMTYFTVCYILFHIYVTFTYIPVAISFTNVFGAGTGKIMLYGISCTGSPSRLVDCSYSLVQGYSSGGCYLSYDAGIRCYGMLLGRA